MLDQYLGESPDLPRRMAPWWPDDEDSAFGQWVVAHHGDQRSGCQSCLSQEIWQRGYAKPCDGSRSESRPVIRFEPALRMDGNRLVSVDETPRLRALHECLVRE
jgi:hypothetical protein